MKCIICNNTEKKFLKTTSAQISQIKKLLKAIDANIHKLTEKMNNQDDKFEPSVDFFSECRLLNNANCKRCIKCESIDDEGYFWCNHYNKSFRMNVCGQELAGLYNDKRILNTRIDILRNLKFNVLEITYKDDIYGNDINYEVFQEIISKYHHSSTIKEGKHYAICPYCIMLINKMTKENVFPYFNDLIDLIDATYKRKEDKSP